MKELGFEEIDVNSFEIDDNFMKNLKKYKEMKDADPDLLRELNELAKIKK